MFDAPPNISSRTDEDLEPAESAEDESEKSCWKPGEGLFVDVAVEGANEFLNALVNAAENKGITRAQLGEKKDGRGGGFIITPGGFAKLQGIEIGVGKTFEEWARIALGPTCEAKDRIHEEIGLKKGDASDNEESPDENS